MSHWRIIHSSTYWKDEWNKCLTSNALSQLASCPVPSSLMSQSLLPYSCLVAEDTFCPLLERVRYLGRTTCHRHMASRTHFIGPSLMADGQSANYLGVMAAAAVRAIIQRMGGRWRL